MKKYHITYSDPSDGHKMKGTTIEAYNILTAIKDFDQSNDFPTVDNVVYASEIGLESIKKSVDDKGRL